jgi:hypothetical protein
LKFLNINIGQRGTIIFCAMLALTAASGMQTARGITVMLVPSADSCMRDVAANTNFGDANPLLIGNAKAPFVLQNRALLKFDLTGIPTDATIIGVTLTVVIFRSNTDPADFDLNRVLVDWSEYEVTWNNRSASTPWLAGGGQSGSEYVAAPSVTAPVDDTIFSSPGMVSDVQLWVRNSATNFGWIMLPTGNLAGTGKQLGSRESEFTPVLAVEYTLTPPTSPPVLFGAAKVENGFRFSFNAQSNRPYAVEFRDALGPDNWNTLTNIPAQPADGIVDITNAVFSMERFFRVRTP